MHDWKKAVPPTHALLRGGTPAKVYFILDQSEREWYQKLLVIHVPEAIACQRRLVTLHSPMTYLSIVQGVVAFYNDKQSSMLCSEDLYGLYASRRICLSAGLSGGATRCSTLKFLRILRSMNVQLVWWFLWDHKINDDTWQTSSGHLPYRWIHEVLLDGCPKVEYTGYTSQ